jgi:hypothetical protein
MKYSAVQDVTVRFPHPIIPTVQGRVDCKTIHAIRKLLQANARAIDTDLGGGALVHLGIIVYVAAYSIFAPTHPWVNPVAPGPIPAVIYSGTEAQLSTAIQTWEENVLTFRTYNTVQQSLKKQIITVFEPMYWYILNDDIVGIAHIIEMQKFEHLFLPYGSITAVDLEHHFEHMRKAWDPQQPLETLFNHIQDCVDFSESG